MTSATSNLLVLNLLPLKFESIPPKAITMFHRHETSAHVWCERGCETGDSQRICISGRLYVYILILWVWINAKHLSLQCQLSFRSLKAEPHLNAFMRSFFAVSYVLNTSQAVGMKHEDPNGESMSMFKNQFLVPVVTMPVILIKHRWRVFCARGHTEPVYGLNKHE